MKLRSLRLHGFKSFADRTTLDFRDGVTAVIGSNGCGKSNIADSIRWVLGEQRASAIRGSKMEEVIFQGTSRRRPVNLAEVTLVFDNSSGRVPVPQSELEVSRKVFREGGSEYLLNRNPCRLRDVTGLLRGTGLGSNAYAIIEAVMIETLLSDRAEERRALFEEAAGIGRYKDSRQAATRRLEAAEGDLARLQDLIAEVDSKVRTLARQSRRAERHRDLLSRRLDLEVAIARHESVELNAELQASEMRRRELDVLERSAATERATAETVLEERRAEAAQLGRERSVVAERLEQLRRELDGREREMLIADERRSQAEERIQSLQRERSELLERRGPLAEEVLAGEAERAERSRHLERVRGHLAERGEVNQTLRAALNSERARAEEAAARGRELAREIAALEGERAAAERSRLEAAERLAALDQQELALASQLDDLSEQTELWTVRAEDVQLRLDAAGAALEEMREEVSLRRRREQEARDRLADADDRLTRLASLVAAREALERAYEGFAPAVAAVMSDPPVRGVLGPLADFVRADPASHSRTQATEAFLGPLLQALIVEDMESVRALRSWFRSEWRGGGSLLLLPLDVVGGGSPAGGEAWVRTLLDGLEIVDGDPLHEPELGTARVGAGGDVMDARGVVRLAEQGDGEGILARRESLMRLRREREDAAALRERAAADRDGARQALAAAEERLTQAEERQRLLEAELRRVAMDSAAHEHHHGRLKEDREELARTVAGLRHAMDQAGARIAKAGDELATLSSEVGGVSTADTDSRARLEELERRWEAARDEEAELRVTVARAESDLREAERRAAAALLAQQNAADRLARIDQEIAELRATVERNAEVRSLAADEIQQLFDERDAEAGQVMLLEARLAELDSELTALAERARAARRQESEGAEERHRLDLRIAELRTRIERARELLEVEWGRPWDALLTSAATLEEGDPDEWRRLLREVRVQIDGIGPVNMLATEEHAEEERRLHFLTGQRDDLVRAREDLVNAIREINRTARELFAETFVAVRENFQRVFQSLFQGGECDVWLSNPDDPLESTIEIQASPKGKRTQRIHLLSGGERTLTALALLFALYLVKPSPFCVLDEVDAPLDDSNVGRFVQLLQDFKSETQFIVITHNPRTMEAADWVYGVTMEEPGVSTIVGVELLGAWQAEGAVPAAG